MHKYVDFSLEQLHEKVWAQPLLVIAREIGVSDVALGKACRKAGIPLPGRGYWAALKAGKTVPIRPLPKRGEDAPGFVRFTVLADPPERQPKVPTAKIPPIAVPTKLLKPHRLVAEWQSAVKGASEDKGVLVMNFHKYLRIRTSSAQLTRALILMDTLIKQFEGLGLRVRIGEQAETELVLKEGVVSFRLDERTTRREPPPLPPRAVRKGRYEPAYEPWRPAYVMVGTGEFTLEFGKYRLGGCRHTWKDKAKLPLEAQLHEVMEAIPSWEAVLKARRIEQEEEKARFEAEEERRLVAGRAREVLRLRRVRLVDHLEAWERAQRLRQFILAVEQVQPIPPGAGKWLDWARAQIKALDPLESNLPKLLSLKIKLDTYFTGYSSWNNAPEDWWTKVES